ncbi:hypothetical protein EBB07_01375 [Paenibacillaceae bacterium]|nr:hypothetical protein EBB07_01375 [Paenibacillaceae bacterium]
MIELLLDDRLGKVWDIGGIVTDISWKTTRIGKAGSLEFTLIKGGLYENRSFSVENGHIIRFYYNGNRIFYGYIFSIDGGRDEALKITAYDQIRYLMASDTYVFSGVTASDVIGRIAKDFKLKLGRIDTPSYKIPTMVEDTQKLLDIIDKALTLTLINKGENYILFDDFGELSLRLIDDMMVEFVLGDDSLLYNYTYKKSIDSDTYNKIKLVQDNKTTGKRDVHIVQDSGNIARWGMLQLYQKVDDNLNTAQIRQQLDTLAQLKNRESKSISLEALGDPRVRAGCYVPLVIEEYDINQPFLIDSCTHRFAGEHTMSLELKVL